MSKPLAIDLCCGRGGWTRGLQAAGWEVIGFDVVHDPLYPADLALQDVRTLRGEQLRAAKLICASPPCHEFSYRDLPFGRKTNLPPPDLSIVEACFEIARDAGIPMVLENVRGLQKWFQPARQHYGPYYLWGDVPALIPIGDRFSVQKGFLTTISPCKREAKNGSPVNWSSSSPKRKNWTAQASMIPFELARHIGQCFIDHV